MVKPVKLLPQTDVQMLDRYQLIGEIASGGMATVFLARLPGAGGFSRLVAIKRLHPHLASEPEFVEMFLDEARLAAGIHHQNVVPIIEIGTSRQGYYLVMDFIEGVTLARLLSHAATAELVVPLPVVLRVMIDALSGLHAAHELVDEVTGAPLGVVHRDCSPQNVLVGLDGAARITDFGIARASSRIASTREGAMKGKLAYMAPEQTQGESIDRRADLFSVTVLLWEALAGKRLFRGRSDAETLRRILVEPIPSLCDVAPDVHPAFHQVCARGLERDPDARFQTAVEMVEAIEAAAREWGRDAGEAEPIASHRSVAALMHERYGEPVNEQRRAVRKWLAARQPAASGLGPPSLPGVSEASAGPADVSEAAPTRPEAERAPPEGSFAGEAESAADEPIASGCASEVTPGPTVDSGGEPARRSGSRAWLVGLAALASAAGAFVLFRGGESTEAPPAVEAPAASPAAERTALAVSFPADAAPAPSASAPANTGAGGARADGELPAASASASSEPAEPSGVRAAPPKRWRSTPPRRPPPAPTAAPGENLANPYR